MTNQLKQILDRYINAKSKRGAFELGFNIFSLVSDTYYKENFHSEIISALLNPNGAHGEGNLFLMLFIEHLEKLGISIDKNNYNEGHKWIKPLQNLTICSGESLKKMINQK